MFSPRVLALLAAALNAARAQDCLAANTQPRHEQARRLHNDLLCDYNTEFRPVLDHRDTVVVKVGLVLKYVNFDAAEEVFISHSWVSFTWQDLFLKWNPDDYAGINRTFLESHQIWIPELALFNADASKYQTDAFATTCKIWYNGTVTCMPRVVHTGICRTSLKRWPYDRHNCTMYFGSWMHTGEQINFKFSDEFAVNTEQYEDGPGWRLLDVETKRYPGRYNCCPNDSYPMLRYAFIMERAAAGPAAIVVVPCVAIVALTLVSLLMDVKDNTRLILTCFSLLCHFLFLSEIGYDIPKESPDTPIILLFIRDSMVVTMSGVLLTLLLMDLRERATPTPAWLARAVGRLAAGPARYAVFTEFDPAGPAPSAPLEGDSLAPARPSDWHQLSNLLNSLVLAMSVLTYAVLIIFYIPYED